MRKLDGLSFLWFLFIEDIKMIYIVFRHSHINMWNIISKHSHINMWYIISRHMTTHNSNNEQTVSYQNLHFDAIFHENVWHMWTLNRLIYIYCEQVYGHDHRHLQCQYHHKWMLIVITLDCCRCSLVPFLLVLSIWVFLTVEFYP